MRFSVSVLCLLLPLAAAADSAEPYKSPRAGFNPDISLILDGNYAALSYDPATYTIPGYLLGPEAGPGKRGFSLAESELVMSANVDDLFYGQFTAAVAPEGGVAVEEAYIQTLGLPQGFTLRAGRFYSGIGYINSQHAHVWDFADMPLPYSVYLDNQYSDDGAQLRWVAPTDLFLELGGEWLSGANWPAGGEADNGKGSATLFVHLGGDVGVSHAWRAGLSYLRAKADERLSGAVDSAPDAFSGTTHLTIIDFVWKWAPNGNPRERNFKFQAEYLRNDQDGSFTTDVNSVSGAAVTAPLHAVQSGWYAQAIYQFIPQWRVGLRYDQLHTYDVDAGANAALFASSGDTPWRASLMLDWSHSEFSRVRLQYTSDHSQPEPGSQVLLQYIMSLGAHGAHTF